MGQLGAQVREERSGNDKENETGKDGTGIILFFFTLEVGSQEKTVLFTKAFVAVQNSSNLTQEGKQGKERT